MPEKLKTQNGLRALAILILVVGFGLLSLVNQDAASFAQSLVKHVHLNPASKDPHIFIQAVAQATNALPPVLGVVTVKIHPSGRGKTSLIVLHSRG